MRPFRFPLLLATLALAAACGPKAGPEMPPSDAAPSSSHAEGEGMILTLRDGSERAKLDAEAAPTPLDPLDEHEIAQILARLGEQKLPEADAREFRFPKESKPRPQTIERVELPAALEEREAPDASEDASRAPLEILRFAPEGEVELARNYSVTFNQPMVAVGSHAESVEGPLPVKLSPSVEGKFRWVGARTLLFEPEVRLPMATDFKVSVGADARSASGKTLGKAAEFRFTTPPPKLIGALPAGSSIPLDPVMALVFDQRVDPELALKSVHLEAGGRGRSIRLADSFERRRSPAVLALLEALERDGLADRALVFVADEPLPAETAVTMRVQKGFPSAEGPKTTEKEQKAEFRTFARLSVADTYCGYGRCVPGAPLSIRFNNALDPDAFDPSSIRIEPEPRFLEIAAHGASITLSGETAGRTEYRVTLPSSLRDAHGQTLGEEKSLVFEVGDAHPIFHAESGLTILDPASERPLYTISTVNIEALEVEVYRVSPSDYAAYLERPRDWDRQPPGKRVVKKRLKPEGSPDHVLRSSIDLSEAMKDGLGHAIVRARPVDWPNRHRPMSEAWVMSTRLGADVFRDEDSLLALISDLRDGKGIEGAKIELGRGAAQGQTDQQGLARVEEVKRTPGDWLIATKDGDSLILPLAEAHLHPAARSADGSVRRQLLLGHSFTDRGIYRPGENVSIKGILRVVSFDKRGDVELGAALPSALRYRVLDAVGNEIAEGQIPVNPRGGFDLRVQLPEVMNHGAARAHFEAIGGASPPSGLVTSFTVQSFRTPSFEVAVETPRSSATIGETAQLKARARYYAGGPLGNSEIRWELAISDAYFSPPNHEKFHFGRQRRWFGPIHPGFGPAMPEQRESLQGRTNASGEHLLEVDLKGVNPPFAKSILAHATVEDRDRQPQSAGAALLIHPAEAYLGLRAEKNFVESGEEFVIEAIVVDHAGKTIPSAAIEVKARLRGMSGAQGEDNILSEERCELRSGDKPVRCVFTAERGGVYEIIGDVRDEKGRISRTELSIWVSGASAFSALSAEQLEEEQAILIPERERYAPGDRAKILIQAPFEGGEGVFTLRRSGLLEHQKIVLDGRSAIVEFDVLEEHLPNVHLGVALNGSAPRSEESDQRRPAFAQGNLNLELNTSTRALEIALKPEPSELSPGGEVRVSANIKGADGEAVEGAELTLIVVDEAILALIDHRHADPLSTFYPMRQEGVADAKSRHFVRLMDLRRMEELQKEMKQLALDAGVARTTAMPMLSSAESAPAPSSGGTSGGASPIAIRADFRPLAFFGPELLTDKDGNASASFTLPDNLTRYRVVAIASEGARFGKAESSLVARLPLMIRASAPRFLNYGDRFELPIMVQNQTDQPIEAKLALRASNLRLVGAQGSSVTVPPNERVELRFPAEAIRAGEAIFEAAISAPGFSDALRGEIPIYTPVTVEAFAHYGEIDGPGARIPYKRPEGVADELGGLEISLSSTELASLRDTVLFFERYPFAGTEQIASRLLSFAALRDLLTAFGGEGMPERASYEARIKEDLDELKRRQRDDGGFDFWGGRGERIHPFISVHVAHALIRAKAQGISVDGTLYGRSIEFLRRVEDHLESLSAPPLRRAVIAYALYARALTDDVDLMRARELIQESGGIDKTPLETLGFLMNILERGGDAAELRALDRHITNRITETASAANFIERYQDGAQVIFSSSRRTDGILLEALIRSGRLNDLHPKLLRGLLAHRSKGAGNTQENVFALLAVEAYFRKYESTAPDFMARVWLNERFAGEKRFSGRSAERASLELPMAQLSAEGEVALQREGLGRLYYRVGMRYAPSDLTLDPASHGFAVERVYEAVDDPSDVRREADGSYRIKAGARVRVKLTMVAENRRYHVALVDPLPAGFESLNPALATTEPLPAPEGSPQPPGMPRPLQNMNSLRIMPPWMITWYDHQNLRDEQTEAFASFLQAGVHEYTYYARATTPGSFVAPPPRAAEMYTPETFGRGGTDRVIVE